MNSNKVVVCGAGGFIDDCLKGGKAILASDVAELLNLGSNELASIKPMAWRS